MGPIPTKAGGADLTAIGYPAHLHGDNLVMAALEPMIMSFACAIDMGMIDMENLAARLGSALPGRSVPKRGKAVSS